MDRRHFLKMLGAAGAASVATLPVLRALADEPTKKDDAFIIIHAAGGWDVTLWADPRNTKAGLVDPTTREVVSVPATNPEAVVKHWRWKTAEPTSSFEFVQRNGFALGPVMGDLTDMFDRLTIVNGIAMDTVSHRDGTYYSATGRHLSGGRALQTSIDSILAGEIGPDDLLPLVSVNFPSTFLSRTLDARAIPLRMADVGTVGKSFHRSNLYTAPADRDDTTILLADEAAAIAKDAFDPSTAERMRLQYDALGKILKDPSVLDTFDEAKLQTLQPAFFIANGKRIPRSSHASAALNAAFAVEAIKKKIVRCVSFAARGFDTHNANYADTPEMYQELFDIIATLVRQLDAEGLSNRVHILVISEFCRTPQINLRDGRDHYPNNSALIISPRVKSNLVFGSTDPEQLLPKKVLSTPLGPQPIRPGDVLATMLAAVGIDPRKHLRDGEAIKDLLV